MMKDSSPKGRRSTPSKLAKPRGSSIDQRLLLRMVPPDANENGQPRWRLRTVIDALHRRVIHTRNGARLINRLRKSAVSRGNLN